MPAPTDNQILAPNPSLVALFLVIRTRSGPRFVFHHPPHPSLVSNQGHDRPYSPSHTVHKPKSPQRPVGESIYSEDDTLTNPSEDEQRRSSVATSTDLDVGTTAAAGEGGDGSDGANHLSRTLTADQPGRSKKPVTTTRTFRDEGPLDYEDDDDVSELNLNDPSAVQGTVGANGRQGRLGPSVTYDPHSQGAHAGEHKRSATWDHVLGYSAEGLEKLLCPSRDLKKKRFEVMIERLVFLGYPIFVRDDGLWRKRKGGLKRTSDSAPSAASGMTETATGEQQQNKTNGIDIPRIQRGAYTDHAHSTDHSTPPQQSSSLDPNATTSKSYNSTGGVSDLSEARSSSTSSDGSSEEMTMFHIVFVMDPPPLEYHIRVGEMYDNVAKKFAKALKFEQANTGYVWKEAKNMLAQRAMARENMTPMSVLWPQIMQTSSLAKSIAKVYEDISTNRIARITISDDIECSLQIHQRNETPYAPTPSAPQIPGLWLTNANMLDEDNEKGLSPYAALLLLQDKATLLNEIESDNRELAAPLAYFVRELSPSKSLLKLASRLSLRVRDLQILARHLIYWRRARAIPPLHVRHVYVVSPYADMKSLPEATTTYEMKFKELPSLPRMLQSLSARPIPYGYLIPSQDHKQVYMEMLAWLLRGAWVTQLRTFAWVKVRPEIKAKVASRSRLASQESKKSATLESQQQHKGSAGSTEGAGISAATRRAISDEFNNNATTRTSSSSSMINSVLSPLIRPGSERFNSESGRSEASSVIAAKNNATPTATTNATMAQSAGGMGFFANVWPSSRPSNLHDVENFRVSTPYSEAVLAEEPEDMTPVEPAVKFEPSLISAPHKATAEESQWLACIGEELEDGEAREAWPTLTKYFNGVWAIEDIAAREGMRRSKVWNLFGKLEKEGVLCVVRHW